MDEIIERIKKQHSIPENHTLVKTGSNWDGLRKAKIPIAIHMNKSMKMELFVKNI